MIFSSMASAETADALNAGCFCITGDVEHVHAQLRTAGQAGRWDHLVSRVPVFVSRIAMDRMLATVEAIERTVRLPAISDRLLAAASSAWASSGRSSLEEVAAVAISYLPSKASEFERGIVSGIVLARFLADQAKP